MKHFIRQVLATIVGFFIAMFCFLFFIVALISAVTIGASKEKKIEKNTILVLDLDEPILDYAPKMVIKDFDFQDQEYNSIQLIIKAIEEAKTDEKIKGISIKTAVGISGYAHLKNLRDVLTDFKKSGKFIYAFNQSSVMSQKDYYLNSVADSIFLGVQTEIALQGLGANISYYKDFQEKMGVKMEVFRHGKYKSAVEPYLENAMSEANKEQLTKLLQSVWKNYRQTIATSRNISEERVDVLTDSLLARTPELALKNKLIDAILYSDEYEKILCKAAETEKVKDLKFISILDYVTHIQEEKKLKETDEKEEIAIIYADGAIISGESLEGYVGDKTIIKALREARESENVKAIILRVNSPGGSALASEMMHRELELTKEKKPIYVSMANLAASGGYYIACNANRIFAENETITGSIGVYAAVPNVSELEKKLGISNEQVGTHKYSTGYFRGYNPEETTSEETRKLVTESVETMYKTFVQRVADGRKMSWEQVNELAQGRVWVGADALKNGLVDEIGSLDKVIDYAVKQHNIKKYSIKNFPDIETDLESMLKDRVPFSFAIEKIFNKKISKESEKLLNKMKYLQTEEGVQAKIPYYLEIK